MDFCEFILESKREKKSASANTFPNNPHSFTRVDQDVH
jgi:hypothetical protein